MDNKFVLSESFNDIVFEKRNKKYGAYQIRRTYGRYMLVAGAAAIFFLSSAAFTWAYVQDDAPVMVSITEVDLTDIKTYGDPKLPKEEKKSLPETPVTPPEKGAKMPEPSDKLAVVEEPEVPPSSIDVPKTDPNGIIGGTGQVINKTGGDCVDCPPLVDTTKVVMTIVEWSMYPPTCDGLDEHIKKNIRYPDMCRELGIEGTVYVEFIVDSKGGYRDVKVLRGPHAALNKEALRVMNTMPSWTPAKDEKGNVVEYIMRKPIRFSLTK